MSHLGVHRNRRTELIIFDCDGVLIDSEIIAATALSAALAEDGICIQPRWPLCRDFGQGHVCGIQERICRDIPKL